VARQELRAVCDFDYAVVNDDLARCVRSVLEILRAERAGDAGDLGTRFDPGTAARRFSETGGAR
jgi:hypothetical protein